MDCINLIMMSEQKIFQPGVFFWFTLTIFVALNSCGTEKVELGEASYLTSSNTVRCNPDSKTTPGGIINDESSMDGIQFNVRTPSNYDSTIAHPLLMVFAPAGSNHFKTERMTGFTQQATTAGFIIAYADHPRLTPTTAVQLGAIVGLIAKKWCVNEQRVFLTGHSDGGTVSMALAFMGGTKHIPTAIAPSAAGMNFEALYNHPCPDPIPVMVIHSANDKLFPNYGNESVSWWANCNGCESNANKKLKNGCITYSGCTGGVKTWYCEGTGQHSKWPGRSADIIEFFLSSTQP